MNIDDLLDFAYKRIYNPIGHEIYQLGEYGYLMEQLIYNGTTYLHTEMSGYCAFKTSLRQDFIYSEIVENPDEEIIKDFKAALTYYVKNKFVEGKWVKYTFDKNKYFQEFLEDDIGNQRNKIISDIASYKQCMENYMKMLDKKEKEFEKINKTYSDLFITY